MQYLNYKIYIILVTSFFMQLNSFVAEQELGENVLGIVSNFANAISRGDLTAVKEQVRRNPFLVTYERPISPGQICYTSTGLRFAVWHKQTDIAKFLINNGAKLDENEDLIGKEPLLLIACRNDDIPTMRILAKYKKIDCNFHKSQRYWPFNYHISENVQKELFVLFQNRYYKNLEIQDQLIFAIRSNRKELVEEILSRGADVNKLDSRGNSALLWACRYGNPQIIHLLIIKGASVNLSDTLKGRTGLQWLLRMHKQGFKKKGRQISSTELFPCLFLLLSAGANILIPDKKKCTLIGWIRKKPFNSEELSIFTKLFTIDYKKISEQKELLDDIFNFQRREVEKEEKAFVADFPNSVISDDIYLMKKALVAPQPWFLLGKALFHDMYLG